MTCIRPGTVPSGRRPGSTRTPWIREVAQLPTPTIATRTEPIGLPFLSASSVLRPVAGLAGGCWRCRGCVGAAGAALGVDQVGEPPHLALDRLDAVPLELRGVPVDLLLGHRQLALDPVEPLLEPGAPALEDPQPDLHVGASEEREPDVEVVVLPRGGTDLGHQPLELARCRPR